MYIFSLTCVLAVIAIVVLARNIEDFSISKTLSDIFSGIVLGVGTWVIIAIMFRISHHLLQPIPVEDGVSFAIAVVEVFALFYIYDKVHNLRMHYAYKDKALFLGLSLFAVAFIDICALIGYCFYVI